MVEKTICKVCGKDCKTFIGYIPDKGECCMDCYIIYAKSTEDVK